MIENQPPGQVEDTGSYDSTGYPVKFCWSCREMHRVDHSHHKTLPAQEGQEWEARKSDGHFYCVSTKAGKSFECRMWWVALDLAALLNAQGAEVRRLRAAHQAIIALWSGQYDNAEHALTAAQAISIAATEEAGS